MEGAMFTGDQIGFDPGTQSKPQATPGFGRFLLPIAMLARLGISNESPKRQACNTESIADNSQVKDTSDKFTHIGTNRK
jgi:hypothetical protein